MKQKHKLRSSLSTLNVRFLILKLKFLSDYYNIKKGVKIDELLVLTFTVAAAEEMKVRIKKELQKDESTKDLVPLIDSANISTFDSYFLYLVKKLYLKELIHQLVTYLMM